MATMFDKFRERMQGQRPVGAAEEMTQPMQGTEKKDQKVPLQHDSASIDGLTGSMTQEAQDAYELGRRMGLESLAEMSGQSIPRGQGGTGQIMTKERLNSAMNTLLRYRAGKASVNKRIKSSQEWWKLNNWDVINKMIKSGALKEIPKATAWLWPRKLRINTAQNWKPVTENKESRRDRC